MSTAGCFAFLMLHHVRRVKHLAVISNLTVTFEPPTGEPQNTQHPHLHLRKMPWRANTEFFVSPVCLYKCVPASFRMKVR